MNDIAYILIYIVPLITKSRAAFISVFAILCLILVERVSQHFFSIYSLHLSFDYLAKLSILIPWVYLLHKANSKTFIIIFSSCVFEVITAIDLLVSRQAQTSLYDAYPAVVLVFHLLAALSLFGGSNASRDRDSFDIHGNSSVAKSGKNSL